MALLLGLLVPGLGQAYAGERRRALLWFLGAVVLGTLSIDAMLTSQRPPFNLVVPLGLLLVYYLAELIDAAVTTARNRRTPRPAWDRWWTWSGSVALFLFVVQPAVTAAFQRNGHGVVVFTDAMAPTLFTYDCVMFNKRARTRARGEVIAFDRPAGVGTRTVIARVVGMPGDHVTPRSGPPVEVPPGHVFVEVDNREDIVSFRGLLPEREVIGRANVIYFSADPVRGGIRWRRIGQPVR